MNQGNPAPPLGPASFFHDNGTYQDGGLIFHFPGQQQWVAMFLKFQSQAWHTDDRTGNPLDLPETDGLLRIVGALVNSTESPEREFVTLLNTDSQNVSLEGWRLADRNENHMALSGVVKGGDTLRVEIQAPMQLSNLGGLSPKQLPSFLSSVLASTEDIHSSGTSSNLTTESCNERGIVPDISAFRKRLFKNRPGAVPHAAYSSSSFSGRSKRPSLAFSSHLGSLSLELMGISWARRSCSILDLSSLELFLQLLE